MSPSIEQDLAEQHVDSLSFLWSQRDAATGDAVYDLAGLAELDERVEAHLDALRLGGDIAWKTVTGDLEAGDVGSVFASTVLAVERCNLPAIAHVLDVAGNDVTLARGIVAGLGWVELESVRQILPGLLDPRCPPALRRLGIAACAVHRFDARSALADGASASEPYLRARSLRALGELGRHDMVEAARAAYGDESAECRFWGAWSATLLGDSAATETLLDFAASGGPWADRATILAVRCIDPQRATSWILSDKGAPRARLLGAASLGDPSTIGFLLASMKSDALARLAMQAFVTITGADLVGEKLRGRRPKGFESGPNDHLEDEDIALDPDEDLAWPDLEAVEAWWKRRAAAFKSGTRYLFGKPIANANWLEHVLRAGAQPARAAAALELTLARKRAVLFEVRAPAFRQQRELGV